MLHHWAFSISFAPAGICRNIQGPAKKQFPGCENFVLAVAYHFCLASPEKFSQPGNHSFAGPFMVHLVDFSNLTADDGVE